MSYVISATQARLFGFQYKYAFDEFTVEHPQVVAELKRKTFDLSLGLSEKEGEIRNVAHGVLQAAGLDSVSYTQRSKARRDATRKAAAAYPSPTVSDGGEDEAARLREENERLVAENQQLRDELTRVRAENATLRSEECASCAEKRRDAEALRDELRSCQQERDRWRGRCKAEEREREESAPPVEQGTVSGAVALGKRPRLFEEDD
jgi:predicted RNase H-like nuclease (RuvC/YqgF family)